MSKMRKFYCRECEIKKNLKNNKNIFYPFVGFSASVRIEDNCRFANI